MVGTTQSLNLAACFLHRSVEASRVKTLADNEAMALKVSFSCWFSHMLSCRADGEWNEASSCDQENDKPKPK